MSRRTNIALPPPSQSPTPLSLLPRSVGEKAPRCQLAFCSTARRRVPPQHVDAPGTPARAGWPSCWLPFGATPLLASLVKTAGGNSTSLLRSSYSCAKLFFDVMAG